MKTRTFVSLLPLSVSAVLALAGCSGAVSGEQADSAKISVVASTNVYGDIAATIAGDAAHVTAIIDNPSQDPHSFEASARNQLAVSQADVVIVNGGGYDDFMQTMLKAADRPDTVVLNAVELSGLLADEPEATEHSGEHNTDDHGEFNEHVWYDFDAMGAVAEALVDALSSAAPSHAGTFAKNGTAFTTELNDLQNRTAKLTTAHVGEGAAVTEPVPLYLLAAVGLVNKTPEEFSAAVEQGTDVSPAVLKETVGLFATGAVALLAYNEQTSGPETQKVLTAAKDAAVPVVSLTETLPDGKTYISWMSANLDAIAKALSA